MPVNEYQEKVNLYRIFNDQNDCVYIGATTFPVEKRFGQHIRDSRKERYKGRRLYKAMNTIGVEHFHCELILTFIANGAQEYLGSIEKIAIEAFDSVNNGYNEALGGAGKPLYTESDKDLCVETYKELGTIKDTAACLGISVDTVTVFLKERNIRIRSTGEVLEVAVLKCDKKTHKPLQYFFSVSDAANATNPGYTSHICNVCMGKRKSTGGFFWMYASNATGEYAIRRDELKAEAERAREENLSA